MTGGISPSKGWLRLAKPVTRQQIKPGTVRRILPYARRYRATLALLLTVSAAEAVIIVSGPLLLKAIIDNGIVPRHFAVIMWLSLAVAGLALLDAIVSYAETWSSARVGQGLIYDLRTQVFGHVQRLSLAFFTRTQTGALVSRLNSDVIGAQQAVTTLLSEAVSTILTLGLVLAVMFYLSWQISIVALVMIPLFTYPGKFAGKRLQRLAREQMQLNAEMGTLANERFNVAGAMLTKLYGRPDDERDLFGKRAERVREVAVATSVYGRSFFILLTLLAALVTAMVYGLGGSLVADGTLKLGTIVALVALLARLYEPINQLSSMQINVLTALVSFDRIFEVLDLKSLVSERPDAVSLAADSVRNGVAPDIQFDLVSFRYPNPSEVSLASLESTALPSAEQASDAWTLQEVSFRAPGGKLTALVGPSGAGKTTITYLVPRLYDPVSGTVRIAGRDIRDLTLDSMRETVGVVTQDAHLFHDTIRANLLYARPEATAEEVIEACGAAQIWDMISSLPDGLDTVVGDRGYRLSGGERQRLAIARLLLKGPPIVVLDEATAHLDSESESAIQRALKTALAGRTSLVIAHRLSTIREADQILVLNEGRICERGTHEELLAAGGLYADLYRTQFAPQLGTNGHSPASLEQAGELHEVP